MKHTVTEIELKAGTKGLFIDVPGSEVVSIEILFRAGLQFSDSSKYETPHLIEHHILNATKKYPLKGEIRVEMGRNGAYSNAYTSNEYVAYVVECASFEVVRLVQLLTEILTQSTFNPTYYETEKENVRTELTRNLSDYARQTYMAAAVKNYPELILGFKDRINQLDNITHKDVVDHYHRTHTALNSTFVFAGDLGSRQSEVTNELNTLFDRLPKGKQSQLWDGIGKGVELPIVVPEPIESIYFGLNWFAGGITRVDRIAGRLLRSMLAVGYSSRIFSKARQRGLTYNISASTSWTQASSSFAYSGFCNVSKWDELLSLIVDETADILHNSVSTTELDDAKKRVVGSIKLGNQTASSFASWYEDDYVHYGTVEGYDDYYNLLESVTVGDIKRVAQHLFASTEHSIVLLGNVDNLDNDVILKALKPIWQ